MNRLLIQVGGRRTKMFKDVKVGDKVWGIRRGWGEVSYIEHTGKYPIFVKFSSYVSGKFSTEGKEFVNDINPTLYWDEFRIVPPKKPLPDLDIDTKVLVWDDGDVDKTRAHFHSFTKDGRIVTWECGCTSFTDNGRQVCIWDNWELYEQQ